MSLRLSTVILPYQRWSEGGRAHWQRAEELGFHTAYTYDHLSWRVPFRDGPWFGAVPTLAAAARGDRPTPPRHPRELGRAPFTYRGLTWGSRIDGGLGGLRRSIEPGRNRIRWVARYCLCAMSGLRGERDGWGGQAIGTYSTWIAIRRRAIRSG